MKIKLLPFCFALAVFLAGASAQAQKKTVAVLPFLSPPEYRSSAVELRLMALQVFHGKTNVEFLDRDADTLIIAELNKQMREQSIAAKKLAQQGILSGAQEIIVGTLSNVNVETRGSKYFARLTYTLQVHDASTGVLKASETFSSNVLKQDVSNKVSHSNIVTKVLHPKTAEDLSSATDLLLADTKEQAIYNSIKDAKKDIAVWINKVYPTTISIGGVDKYDSKGLPDIVTVLGFETGVKSGKTIIVSETTFPVAGDGLPHPRTAQIAELRVDRTEGDFTVCKVKDGASILGVKIKDKANLEFKVKE